MPVEAECATIVCVLRISDCKLPSAGPRRSSPAISALEVREKGVGPPSSRREPQASLAHRQTCGARAMSGAEHA